MAKQRPGATVARTALTIAVAVIGMFKQPSVLAATVTEPDSPSTALPDRNINLVYVSVLFDSELSAGRTCRIRHQRFTSEIADSRECSSSEVGGYAFLRVKPSSADKTPTEIGAKEICMKLMLLVFGLILSSVSPTLAADLTVHIPLENTLWIGNDANSIAITCFRRIGYRCDRPPTEQPRIESAYSTTERGYLHHYLPPSASIIMEGVEFRCHPEQQQQCPQERGQTIRTERGIAEDPSFFLERNQPFAQTQSISPKLFASYLLI